MELVPAKRSSKAYANEHPDIIVINQTRSSSSPALARIDIESNTTATASETTSAFANSFNAASGSTKATASNKARFSRVNAMMDLLKRVELPSPKPKGQAQIQQQSEGRNQADASLKKTSPGTTATSQTAPARPLAQTSSNWDVSVEDLLKSKREITSKLDGLALYLETLPLSRTQTRNEVFSEISLLKTRLGIVNNALRQQNASDDGDDASAKSQRTCLAGSPESGASQHSATALQSSIALERHKNEKRLATLDRISAGLNEVMRLNLSVSTSLNELKRLTRSTSEPIPVTSTFRLPRI